MDIDTPLSAATIAKACEYALRFRLIDNHAIRCWGDEMILALDSPPVWAMDLSDCSAVSVEERLRRVPGEPTKEEWEQLLCGLMAIRWKDRELSVGTMRGIGWTLYIDDNYQDTSHWGLELECIGEGYDDGYGTLEGLTAAADSTAKSFTQYQAMVPRWMIENRAERNR